MAQIFVPVALRPLTDHQTVVEAFGATVRDIIIDLERRYPGIQQRLCVDQALRPGLSVVIDGTLSHLGLLQAITEPAEVHFLPSIGGG